MVRGYETTSTTEHSADTPPSATQARGGVSRAIDDGLTPNDRLYAELYAAFWEIDPEHVRQLLRALRQSGLRVRCVDGVFLAWTYPGMSPI